MDLVTPCDEGLSDPTSPLFYFHKTLSTHQRYPVSQTPPSPTVAPTHNGLPGRHSLTYRHNRDVQMRSHKESTHQKHKHTDPKHNGLSSERRLNPCVRLETGDVLEGIPRPGLDGICLPPSEDTGAEERLLLPRREGPSCRNGRDKGSVRRSGE